MVRPQREPLRPLTPHEAATLQRRVKATSERHDRRQRRRPRPGASPLLGPRGARPHRAHAPAPAAAASGRDGDLVAGAVGAGAAPGRGGVGAAERHHHPRRAPCGGLYLPRHPQLVSNRHGTAQAPERGRQRGRPRGGTEKGLIEQAYGGAEAAGVALCCQDEAGPYQTVPYPGARWEPEGHPARQPQEYERTGTAKLLTLFRPATGQVQATGVTHAPNAVLHPWLQTELHQLLASLPGATTPPAYRPPPPP